MTPATSDTELATAKPGSERLIEATAQIRRLVHDARERGFIEGITFVATCIRRAAERVEAPVLGEFVRQSDPDKMFKAIAKSGQVHFAAQLRAVADEIEASTKPPGGTGERD